MEQQGMTAGQIVTDFFHRFFDGIIIQVFIKIYSKEEAEVVLDTLFEENESMFTALLAPLATSNMDVYMDIKKAIKRGFEEMKKNILEMYNASEEIIESGNID